MKRGWREDITMATFNNWDWSIVCLSNVRGRESALNVCQLPPLDGIEGDAGRRVFIKHYMVSFMCFNYLRVAISCSPIHLFPFYLIMREQRTGIEPHPWKVMRGFSSMSHLLQWKEGLPNRDSQFMMGLKAILDTVRETNPLVVLSRPESGKWPDVARKILTVMFEGRDRSWRGRRPRERCLDSLRALLKVWRGWQQFRLMHRLETALDGNIDG